MDLTSFVWLTAIGFAAATLALVAVSVWPRPGPAPESAQEENGIVFLFDGRRLIDATARARRLMPRKTNNADDWTRFITEFAPRFEGLEDQLATLQDQSLIKLRETGGNDSGMVLTAEWKDGMVRLSFDEQDNDHKLPQKIERYAFAAMQDELSTLRCIAEHAPTPVWRQRPDGTVIWANSAYTATAALVTPEGTMMNWPPPVIFPEVETASIDAASEPGHTSKREGNRVSLRDEFHERNLWFEIASVAIDEDLVCFATPMDRQIAAETSQANFLQTVTKTFALLPVGLAIFDRKRQLIMYNPALMDLTALSTEFLVRKPTLRTFLDAMRDNQRIPEPKDYKSWRMQIARLESEGADGTYEETWTLPTGQTYRVRGRPFPDGALAYMLEDISTGISETRQYRSKIQLGMSIFNGLQDQICVFTPTGVLSMANPAFTNFWKLDVTTNLSAISVNNVIAVWRQSCRPGKGVETLESALIGTNPSNSWQGLVSLENGSRLECCVAPVADGHVMVAFRPRTRQLQDASGKVTQGVFMEG